MCSTWAVFRFNEERSAKWASLGLGSIEQLETNEGISYGVNDIRDGVSLNRQRHVRPIVLPTEIQFLPDLVGYLKLGRSFPVAQFKLKRKPLKKIAEGFIHRDLKGDLLEAVEAAPEAKDGNSETTAPVESKKNDYVDGALF
eukprot:TRINITY_DN53595_c0_g1_i1.p1 TRINITY_DN53595_c0_g1~~TRINITY_DN53595_c0_g1_i1.p1  ORF type:complete len:142 (-),score=17.75 TRINITY_DN53595_c0_g1_i1:207-632(-)